MLRTLVGLAVLWTVQSQRCTSDTQCPPKQYCRDDSFVRGECRCHGDWKGVDCDCSATITCNGNGKCDANSECDCTPGWVGAGCDVDCEDARDCRGRGTCNMDGSCLCSDDWTGPRCDCSPSETCNSNGACDPSTFECTCAPGWTGVYCNIPCTPGACNSQGTCGTDQDCGQNQHCDDTFNCLCNPGWIGTNCDKPCALCNNNGYCDPKTTFGLPCICDDNYYGSWCEVFCDDAQCGQGKCEGITGALTACKCDGDWVDWNGATCACSPSVTCSGNGKCEGVLSKCKCDDGWVGTACEFPCDPATTCNGHGTCLPDATVPCQCEPNWHWNKYCSVFCDPSTTCSGNGACLGDGSCKCSDNWKRNDCSVFCDPAATCSGNGACLADGSCKCSDNWKRNDCSVFCDPSTTCSGNGACLGDGSCKCSDNWKRNDCSVFCDPSTTCSGNGACLGDGSCKCSDNWKRNDCSAFCDPSTTCSGNGACLGDGSCKCSDNWKRNDCSAFCDPSTTCSGKGVCLGDGSCKCSDNWVGNGCSIFCDPATTCSGKGVCLGDGSCKCWDTWVWADCSIPCDCWGRAPGPCIFDATTVSSDHDGFRCDCPARFDDATRCRECAPNYSGFDCEIHCTDDVTCHGNGQCSRNNAGRLCNCDAGYPTEFCGNTAMIYGDPHYSNIDDRMYDHSGIDDSGYYAYTDDEVSVTVWNYFCDEMLQTGRTAVERVAILQKSNGDMIEFKRTDTGMETSVKLTSCQAPFMNLSLWSPSIVLPSSMRYAAPQHERGATVSLLDAAGREKMLLTVSYAEFMPGRDPLLSYHLSVQAVLYQKRPVSLDGELGAFFLEAKNGNVLKKSTVTNTCLTGRSAAVLNTDEATTTIPTEAEELATCTSDAAREHALRCCASGQACGAWYAQCLFEECLHYMPGDEGCTDHMIDSLMFKEWGSEKSCFCPSETMTPDHVSQTCTLCKPHYYPLPGPGIVPADACTTLCTSEDCPEDSPYCNSRGECSTAEHMRQREGKHTPALAESAWTYHLPSDKHPCAPGKALGRLVELREVLTPENVGPLTFGDEAIMIEARVRMRSATKWARIVNFGNGAKGSVVFGQRRLSKKLGFETHSFDSCSTAQGRRVNSPVALPEDEDVWTWVAFTLTKEGVATMYHNNEPVIQVSGVALPEFGTRVKNYVRTPKKRSGDGWDGDIEYLTFSTCFVHSPALPSEWHFHLPKAKHPCVPGEVLGRIVQVEDVLPGGSDVGPLTFGDGAIMIEALVQMRNATKWASIIDFGNGAAKGSVVFGQRSVSKKLSFESHPFEACSTQHDTRDVNSPVALPEAEDVWTWVAFTLTKDGVATIYHNNEQVMQVSGVALPEFGTRVKNYVRGSRSSGDGGEWDGAIRHLSVSTCFVHDAPVPLPPVVIPQ